MASPRWWLATPSRDGSASGARSLDVPGSDYPHPDPVLRQRARDALDSELASYDTNAVTVVADLLRERDRWLEWSGGRYPDGSPGHAIDADADGTIVLDDGITTWNPLRALAWAMGQVEQLRENARRGRVGEQELMGQAVEVLSALRGVSNAYGCFAGCTAGLPGGRPDLHTPACRAARVALGTLLDKAPEGGR